MSAPFVAEIRMFGSNFAPKGWATCDGQILPIQQNTALFSLLGTFYGGDGKTTYALPDLQGSSPVHQGQSSTGSQYVVGQQAGSTTVTLLQSEIPFHTHVVQATSDPGDLSAPAADRGMGTVLGQKGFAAGLSPAVTMAPQALTPAGGSLPHNNLQPYLVVNFCIALQGVFPQFS